MEELFQVTIVALNAQPMTSDLTMALRNSIPFDRNNPPMGGWGSYMAHTTKSIVAQIIEIMHLDDSAFLAELQTLPDWGRIGNSAYFSPQTEAGVRRACIEWGLGFRANNYNSLSLNGNFSGAYELHDLTQSTIMVTRDPYACLTTPTMSNYTLG